MSSWEYLYVNACLIPGPGGGEWRVHLVNNESLPDWESGPALDNFIHELEAQGWQLTRKLPNTRIGKATMLTILFKRPRVEALPGFLFEEMEEPPSAWG